MSQEHARGSRLAVKILLTCCSILIAVAVAEIGLRLLDWPPGDPVWETCHEAAFKFKPNIHYRHMSPEYDVVFQTNSLGLRDDEAGPKTGYRILLLGDSFTCGYGVERRDTFADRLERRLGIQIINAGVGGYEIIHQLRYFETQGRHLQPDLVVYALFLGNDLTCNGMWEVAADGGLVQKNGPPALRPPERLKLLCLLKRNTRLRRIAHWARASTQSLEEWQPRSDYLELCAPDLSEQARVNYETSCALLRQLRNQVGEAGADFLVVMLPFRTAVEVGPSRNPQPVHLAGNSTYDFRRPTREMAEFCSSNDIEYVALTDLLVQDHQRLGSPLYYRHDGHLNALGHERVAEHVYPYLARRLESKGVAIAYDRRDDMLGGHEFR